MQSLPALHIFYFVSDENKTRKPERLQETVKDSKRSGDCSKKALLLVCFCLKDWWFEREFCHV